MVSLHNKGKIKLESKTITKQSNGWIFKLHFCHSASLHFTAKVQLKNHRLSQRYIKENYEQKFNFIHSDECRCWNNINFIRCSISFCIKGKSIFTNVSFTILAYYRLGHCYSVAAYILTAK
jgi:hypothetical protein